MTEGGRDGGKEEGMEDGAAGSQVEKTATRRHQREAAMADESGVKAEKAAANGCRERRPKQRHGPSSASS